MKQLSIFYLFILTACSNKTPDNKLIVHDGSTGSEFHYFVLNQRGDTVLNLSPKKYFVCFSDTIEKFLVVAPRNRKGWWAIDLKENYLFEVYNTNIGEPSPDKLIEGKIRIVDSTGRIGFANNKGQIIIKPQFEFITAFSKGKAIIGENCKKIPWDKNQDTVDAHYSLLCNKYGYINEQGEIMELNDSSYEEVVKKINWIEPNQ